MSEPAVEPEMPVVLTGEYEFRGPVELQYPSHLHPERPGILSAEPGEIVDFGSASPPNDGKWYDVRSGQQYLGPSPDVETASAQEDPTDEEK